MFRLWLAMKRKRKKDLLVSPDAVHLYPTLKFFLGQIGPDGTFQAYDVCVRYAFIRDIDRGEANSPWPAIYEKMQRARGAVSHHNADRFMKLIDGFRTVGYDVRSAITLHVSRDGAYLLGDGSHRMACSLYFKAPWVSLAYSPDKRKTTRDYGIDWFERAGFSRDELNMIMAVKDEIIAAWAEVDTDVIKRMR